MRKTIYGFHVHKPSASRRGELAAASWAITPAANIIAEEARRRQVVRTCRIIARRERRGIDHGPRQP